MIRSLLIMDMDEICRGARLGSARASDICSIFGTASSTCLSISTHEKFKDSRVGMDVRFNSCYESLKYNILRHMIMI